MIYSRIIGSGSYLPERVLTNHDLARQVDTSDEWIVSRTGIKKRHIAREDEKSSDLALAASREAIAAAGVKVEDIDLIVVATSTPDLIFPSTASLLQAKLGIHSRCPAFDVQAVCSGFVYGLTIVDAFIRSGQHRCVLVVGTEVFSRILDWKDRSTCVLFGDGAGAVIVKADNRAGIIASSLHADGSQSGILSTPGQVCNGKVEGHPFLTMNGGAVFKYAVKVLEEVALEVLQKGGLSSDHLDWLIPHQANIRIMEALAKKLDMPMSKLIMTIDQHANTSAASVPLALDVGIRDGRIRSGNKVMLQGVGGGFTWGAVLFEM